MKTMIPERSSIVGESGDDGGRRMLDILPAFFIVLREDGSVESMGARFHEFTGLSPEAVRTEGWTAALHPGDLERIRNSWKSCFHAGTAFEGDLRLRNADGQFRWFLTRIVPDRSGTDRIRRWLGISTDIDTQKRAERGLHSFKADLERRVQDRTSELKEALSELEGFSYTVAHDLRAPLRGIHSLAQILQEDCRGVLEPRAEDYLSRIMEASRRMDLLVTDLLSYSSLNRQDLPLYPIELERVVDQVLRDLSPNLRERQALVDVEHPLPAVFGNSVALPLAIRNLVANAVKYVSPGVTPRIVIRPEGLDNRVRLWVEDNGIGIAPEYQERIFDVFERLHPPEEYSGTGIGLAIVRRAMEKMWGKVGVESSPGRGSRFWIELPRSMINAGG